MNSQSLKGKNALVTGASRGIGRAVASRLAREGALVAVHYSSSSEAAEEVVKAIGESGGQAFSVRGDVREVSDIDAMFATLDSEFSARSGSGTLDVLVNNAGLGGGATSIADSDEAFYDNLFDTNAKGMFFVLRAAQNRLADGAKVVNISSLSTRGAMPALAAYAASKTPINSLTQSFAALLGPRKIAVNAIAPGFVATDLTAHMSANEEFMAQYVKSIPFGRVGQPEDIANAVAMLVSPDNTWITGQIIEATGGARL